MVSLLTENRLATLLDLDAREVDSGQRSEPLGLGLSERELVDLVVAGTAERDEFVAFFVLESLVVDVVYVVSEASAVLGTAECVVTLDDERPDALPAVAVQVFGVFGVSSLAGLPGLVLTLREGVDVFRKALEAKEILLSGLAVPERLTAKWAGELDALFPSPSHMGSNIQ